MADHSPWQDWLPFYVAGTLPSGERDRLEAHLRTCKVCQAEIIEWRHIAAAVRADAAKRVYRTLPFNPSQFKKLNDSLERMRTMTAQLMPIKRQVRASSLISAALLIALVAILAALMYPSALPPGYGAAGQSRTPVVPRAEATQTPYPTATAFYMLGTPLPGTVPQVAICGIAAQSAVTAESATPLFDVGVQDASKCHLFNLAFTHENAPVDIPAYQRPLFGGMFMLRGIAFSRTNVAAGDSISIALLWEIGAAPTDIIHDTITLSLVNSGQIIAQYRQAALGNMALSGSIPYSNIPIEFNASIPGGISLTNCQLQLSSALISDTYTVLVSIDDVQGKRLTLSDGSTFYAIGSLYVMPGTAILGTPPPKAVGCLSDTR